MTEASYPRLALLLQLICFSAIYMAPSHAFSVQLRNRNGTTIEQNVQNLVDTLTANPDIAYGKSMMLGCYTAVDHGDHDPEHFHDYPLSSNISHFRDIRCVFQYGGPIAEEGRSLFLVENQWPLHWDRWRPPTEDVVYFFEILPFSWRQAVSYMGSERADRLLKADGHRGPYASVDLVKTMAHPDGAWCFLKVQMPDGGQRNYHVDVRTGRVEQTLYCQDWRPFKSSIQRA